MTRRRWVLRDLNSRFNCLNPRYNVGTPFFAPVDDYADEHPNERDDAASASDRHEAGDRDPAEAHARLQRDARAEQQAESYGKKGVAEQSLLERSCHMCLPYVALNLFKAFQRQPLASQNPKSLGSFDVMSNPALEPAFASLSTSSFCRC